MRSCPISVASLCALLALFWTSTASSRIWHVNIGGTGDAPTIQAAIDSSSAGDTVLVGPGTYPSSLPIGILSKDSLTVLSEDGPVNTLLNAIDVNFASHVNIIGFTFQGFSHGIVLYWSHHIRVENNIVRNTTDAGLSAYVSSELIIMCNLFHSCSTGVATSDASDDLEICGNTISHCAHWGIYTDASVISIKNNIISFNDVGVSAYGPYFHCNDAYGNGTNYDLLYGGDPTGTNGNICVPPLFCGIEPQQSGNYYLQSISPCAPGNHPDGYSCGLIGGYPVGCKNTVVRQASWGGIKSLYK